MRSSRKTIRDAKSAQGRPQKRKRGVAALGMTICYSLVLVMAGLKAGEERFLDCAGRCVRPAKPSGTQKARGANAGEKTSACSAPREARGRQNDNLLFFGSS